jgi:2-desacetyl-2-hydroxyethyl bacteriochlorophyllide A dehydrogenase
MSSFAVYFTGIRKMEVREEKIPVMREHQVLVQTHCSAISSGTEMLFYHGLVPQEIPMHEKIPVLARRTGYPFKYGYAAVGRVIDCGKAVDPKWSERPVFAFHPHESYFAADPHNLIDIEDMETEDAAFLANMETAVNFMMDGRPVIGERVLVFGQGVVGLLTTSMLAQFPLAKLITVEPHETRRNMSTQLGAHACLDPSAEGFAEKMNQLLDGNRADLVYELTGNPQALEQAIPLTEFGGRIIIGSWYGTKKEKISLNSEFHRRRIQIMSSQVSTLAPAFSGTWTKDRRLEVARQMVRRVKPSRLITHRFPIQEAKKAYAMLEVQPGRTIGVVLTY